MGWGAPNREQDKPKEDNLVRANTAKVFKCKCLEKERGIFFGIHETVEK